MTVTPINRPVGVREMYMYMGGDEKAKIGALPFIDGDRWLNWMKCVIQIAKAWNKLNMTSDDQ